MACRWSGRSTNATTSNGSSARTARIASRVAETTSGCASKGWQQKVVSVKKYVPPGTVARRNVAIGTR